MGWSEGRAVVGMEVDFQISQECRGRRHQVVAIVPPAMAGQLRLEGAPQPLEEVELGRVRRQEEGLEPVSEAQPMRAHRMTRVVAGVVEHDHGRFVGRQRLNEVVQQGHERVLPLARAGLPEDVPAGVVDRAKDGAFVVVA